MAPHPSGSKENNGKEAKEKVKAPESRKKVFSGVIAVVRDITLSAGIVVLILVSLYAYTGVWPPMVVIESNSMMHGNDSQVGVIDTGDLTLVKSIKDRHDVVTYVEATCATNPRHGFQTYGDYGNVIVYRKNGLSDIPVIHRAIAWVEYNESGSCSTRNLYTGDVPDLHLYNVTGFSLTNVGYQKQTIFVNLASIFRYSMVSTSHRAHDGFVTHGDHNPPQVDQESLKVRDGMVEPVKVGWVVGRAEGELPWFGLFKLWISGHNPSVFPESSKNGLVITVFLLIAVPVSMDLAISLYKKRKESKEQVPKKIKKKIIKHR